MLTPKQIQSVANDITEIYAEIENTCIREVVERLTAGMIPDDVHSWQLAKLSQAGALTKSLTRSISVQSKIAIKDVQILLQEALARSGYADNKIFAEMDSDNKLTKEQIISSPAFQKILKTTIAGVKRSLNLTNTMAIQASQKMYVRAINNSFLRVATGTSTLPDAVLRATHEIGRSGVQLEYGGTYGAKNAQQYVTYSSGVRCPLDSAVRRDIVTQVNQASASLCLEDCDQLECDLVETSWHIGSRPEHEIWQGKVFSLSGNSSKFPDFRSSTGYGEVDGLCGINCRHSFQPYYEELGQSSQNNKPTAEENEIAYRNEQTQRAYERRIRALKREKVACEAGGYNEDLGKINARLTAISTNYRAFLSQAGLARESFRERI